MPTKAEVTSAYIIKTVAPVFNKKGYSGTSMQDITLATGLTKGAIYGNFKNKNELAVMAFVYNIKSVTSQIELLIQEKNNSIDKLLAIADFYKNYYQYTYKIGGCPFLNIGIDANHQNPELLSKVKKAIHNIQQSISKIINYGIQAGELKEGLDSLYYARQIFSRVEGAVFMSMTTKNDQYMKDMTKSLISTINFELKK